MKNNFRLENYVENVRSNYREEKEKSILPRINFVPKNQLHRQGAEAFYNTLSKEITLPAEYDDKTQFLEAHEYGHHLGILDEYRTDCYAGAKTGKFQHIRTPLKEPDILRRAA